MPGRLESPPVGSRQDLYLRSLKALTDANGTQLIFLQVPSLWRPPASLERYAYYRQFGPVLIPDLRVVYRLSHYADPSHLFGEGRRVFNRHLADLLREGPTASPYHRHYLEIEELRDDGTDDP